MGASSGGRTVPEVYSPEDCESVHYGGILHKLLQLLRVFL
jgi:hypothetical protein